MKPEFEFIKKADKKSLREINSLMNQLSAKHSPLPASDFKKLIKDKNTNILGVLEKDKIVGMGSVIFSRAPAGFKAHIEDVVIDERFRGKGLGKRLVQNLIDYAKKSGVKSLHLTSRPERTSANNLYRDLGFEKVETNVYRIKF